MTPKDIINSHTTGKTVGTHFDDPEISAGAHFHRDALQLLHENRSKQRLRNLLENFKSKFKPVTENFQENLHQKESKQSKCVRICASIRKELECEKFSKTFCKVFTRQNMQKICKIKQVQNIPVTLRTFSNQLKTFQKNFTVKRTPLTLPHLKF